MSLMRRTRRFGGEYSSLATALGVSFAIVVTVGVTIGVSSLMGASLVVLLTVASMVLLDDGAVGFCGLGVGVAGLGSFGFAAAAFGVAFLLAGATGFGFSGDILFSGFFSAFSVSIIAFSTAFSLRMANFCSNILLRSCASSA